MFRNYFKVALRSLIKGRLYSFINILGLSVGTAVCLLILLFVADETSYDTFHQDADRVYRAWVKEHFKDQLLFNSVTPVVLGPELRDNFPGIEHVARYVSNTTSARKETFFEQEQVMMADPEFLDVFDFRMLAGTPANALTELHNVVITPSIARKYFGEDSPLGASLELQVGGEWTTFRVSGILEEPPSNSSVLYSIIIPFDNIKTILSEQAMRSWTIIYVETYLKLHQGVDADQLASHIAPFIDEKVSSIYDSGEYIVGLQPLTDIHLNGEVPQGLVQVSDRRYIYILSGIGLLILLLACINFTTIAIGRSVTRAREVGIRKVTGATRAQIMGQFWGEAIVTVLIAVILGFFLALLLLPLFNQLSGKSMAFAMSGSLVLWLAGLVAVTGLIAGIYPALVLSRFQPMQVIRGVFGTKTGDRHIVLRWLVGLQYVISLALIICTLVVQDQIRYLQQKDLGYHDDQVVAVPYNVSGQGLPETWEDAQRITEVLRNDLLGSPDVIDIATASHTFGAPGWFQVGYVEQSTDRFRQFTAQQVSANYLDMMRLKIVAGRKLHAQPDADMKSVLINESMARAYEWDDPVGQFLPGPFIEFQVVGVVRDFHFAPLYEPIGPIALTKDVLGLFAVAQDHNFIDFPNPKLLFKLRTGDLSSTLAQLQSSWERAAPEHPFNFQFLDEQTAQQYAAEVRLSRILRIATGLAILIACLGLFGIGVLTAARRTKEIGVRRILGASTAQIILLLNRPFSRMVLIGAIIAVPAAGYVMQHWLEGFAYRVSISPLIFLVAIAIALVFAWLAVGYQSVRAALANPARSLRDE